MFEKFIKTLSDQLVSTKKVVNALSQVVAKTILQSNLYGMIDGKGIMLPLSEHRTKVIAMLTDNSQHSDMVGNLRKVLIANLLESVFYPAADQLLALRILREMQDDMVDIVDVAHEVTVANGHKTQHPTHHDLTKVKNREDLAASINNAVAAILDVQDKLYNLHIPEAVAASDEREEDLDASAFAFDLSDDDNKGNGSAKVKGTPPKKQSAEDLAAKYKTAKEKGTKPDETKEPDIATEEADS